MDLNELQNSFAKPGRVVTITVREERLIPVKVVDRVLANKDLGLEGDHHQNSGARQVTLIQAENLKAVASFLGLSEIDAGLTRRNIVVEGINLLALKGKTFRIGEAVFEYSGDCHPCSRMEKTLGQGGYNAMRGMGGITARIISSGMIAVNDLVTVL